MLNENPPSPVFCKTNPDKTRTPVELLISSDVFPPRSRPTREGPPHVHHPQAGRAVFPGPQRGQRLVHALPGILPARPALLHHRHAAGAPQPGDERRGHHAGEAGHRGPGAAHPEGNQGGGEAFFIVRH